MKSQFTAGKLFLVGTLVLLSSLFCSTSLASADSASTFVPNTTACYASPITKNVNGGTFTVVWDRGNTFTIDVTKAPTSDIRLYASSYHLTNPGYSGGCFRYNSTTSPQTWDNNTQTITLPAGQTGTKVVTVVLPDTCYNEQVDLYFGNEDGQPLNGTVGGRGHDNYGYIAGNIMLTSKNPACNPATPTQPTTPTTPSTPQVLGASTTKPVATLTNTGLPVAVTSSLAIALMGSAIVVSRKKAPALDDIAL